MATNTKVEVGEFPDGLPRRRAIQGIAGSLAGIAALGAMSASGKKKKKKKNKGKGTLVKFETVQDSEDFGTIIGTPTTVSVSCPAAGTNEAVYVVGGGYSIAGVVGPIDANVLASEPTGDGQGWTATVNNTILGAKTLTTTAICAYFKTK